MREVLFDNWYFCHNFVSLTQGKEKDWISTLKSDDVIYRVSKQKKEGREFTVEKLVNSLPLSYFQMRTKVCKDYKEEKRNI